AGLYRRVSALAAALGGAGAGLAPGGQCAELTPREREIISLVERGLSNKQIGAQLSIELATVKNHVHNILEKLQVRRRSDAVARVQRPAALFPFVFDTTQRMTEPQQSDGGRGRI
ncbi:MAG: response regulator transcription factor, partial [Gemmatimonadaceae bacterium]